MVANRYVARRMEAGEGLARESQAGSSSLLQARLEAPPCSRLVVGAADADTHFSSGRRQQDDGREPSRSGGRGLLGGGGRRGGRDGGCTQDQHLSCSHQFHVVGAADADTQFLVGVSKMKIVANRAGGGRGRAGRGAARAAAAAAPPPSYSGGATELEKLAEASVLVRPHARRGHVGVERGQASGGPGPACRRPPVPAIPRPFPAPHLAPPPPPPPPPIAHAPFILTPPRPTPFPPVAVEGFVQRLRPPRGLPGKGGGPRFGSAEG